MNPDNISHIDDLIKKFNNPVKIIKFKDMKKQILTTREEKKYLQKLFNCTNVMVWKALNYESDSDLARRIRKAALERGGKLTNGGLVEWETTHQTADKTMTQTFGDRVKIIMYTEDEKIVVLVDGKVRMEKAGLSVPEFMELQKDVQLLASSL